MDFYSFAIGFGVGALTALATIVGLVVYTIERD